MARITPKQAREYLDRWTLVHQAEVESLRATSLETKLRQLATLMASRSLFASDADRRVGEVRDRWARIRRALHG